MFKPSLKRSVLNDKLCIPIQSSNPFKTNQPKSKTINIPKLNNSVSKNLDNNHIPSIIVPEDLLIKKTFTNAKHYTHIFTPLSYDFKPYPKIVKEIISPNPNAAQAGKVSNQINFIIHEKLLILWKDQNMDIGQQQKLKIHKFQQTIDIVEASSIKNISLFRHACLIIVAIVFKNKISLFKLDQSQLKLEDLMIKYKLKSCRKIHKVLFTQHNQIIFSGDNGQVSILSFFNSKQKQKQKVITVKSPILKKYLSSSAFDYSTQYFIREISVNSNDQNYIYVLTDSIKKSSYLMYCLKKTVNKFIKLKQQPNYIHQQTFIDIYKFGNQMRNNLVHVDRIKQKDIHKRLLQSYANINLTSQSGFSIVAINANTNFNNQKSKSFQLTADQFLVNKQAEMKNQSNQQNLTNSQNCSQIPNPYYLSPQLYLFTKCGYIIRLIHYSQPFLFKDNLRNQNFLLLSQPEKIPLTIYGQASLLESKTYLLAIEQDKKQKQKYMIQSLGCENLSLMNNMLVFYGKGKFSFLKIEDMKKGLYQDKSIKYLRQNQAFYMELADYERKYQKKIQKERGIGNNEQRERDGFDNLNPDTRNIQNTGPHQYIKLYNNQRKWTIFDNQGQSSIYLFELRHIILIYLHFKLEFCNHFNQRANSSIFSQLDSDIRFHSIIEKIIRIYGLTNFLKALIQILMFNTKDYHEFFYVQKQFLLEIIRKQFDYEPSVKFDQWNYKLQPTSAERIVATQKILKFVWILLFEYEHKNVLSTQNYQTEEIKSEYFKLKQQYQDVENKLSYTAYGNALQMVFFENIEPIIYFKAKQFKQKNKLLVKSQQNLIQLLQFIKNKKQKYQSHEFNAHLKSYLTKKIPQSKTVLSSGRKLMNATLSTNYEGSHSTDHHQQDTLYFHSQTQQTARLPKSIQPSQFLQQQLLKCIKKVNLIINVMGVLSQKDSRENLPNFIQILTNIKSQILIGEYFFSQELLINQKSNVAELIHTQLVKKVQFQLPEFRITDKIDYLKFKVSRNILNTENQMTQTDLKSLNLKKLSSIITSAHIPDIRKVFLGKNAQFDSKKYYFYIQYLSVCMSRNIQQIRELSTFKEQKFNTDLSNSSWRSSLSNITISKLIICRQKLSYVQQQLDKFYEQVKFIFDSTINSLKVITGTKYYQTEKYLDYMIELLIENFGYEDVLVQFIQIELKKSGLVGKVNEIRKIVQNKFNKKAQHHPLLKLVKQKQFQAHQNSTFKYFLQNDIQKSMQNTMQNTTLDTNH